MGLTLCNLKYELVAILKFINKSVSIQSIVSLMYMCFKDWYVIHKHVNFETESANYRLCNGHVCTLHVHVSTHTYMKARSQGPDNTCTLMLYFILNCSHSLILSPLFCDLLQAWCTSVLKIDMSYTNMSILRQNPPIIGCAMGMYVLYTYMYLRIRIWKHGHRDQITHVHWCYILFWIVVIV